MRINKIAAGSVLSVISAGSIMLATAPAGALGFANVAVSPNTNLVNGQKVTVVATGFPASDAGMPMYTFECAQQALSSLSQDYCDTTPADVNNTGTFSSTLSNGKAYGTVQFTVLTGANFHPVNTAGKCEWNANPTALSNSCLITVADTATQTDSTTVGLGGNIKFKDPRAATKTTVKAPKTAKAGKTIKVSIKVTGSHPTGKVVVTDKGKKVGAPKLSSTGTAKVKEKHAKKGKHKFVATYGGDKNNQPSHGKAKTTVK